MHFVQACMKKTPPVIGGSDLDCTGFVCDLNIRGCDDQKCDRRQCDEQQGCVTISIP